MKGVDILDFIKTGEIKGIKLGMSVAEVHEKLAEIAADMIFCYSCWLFEYLITPKFIEVTNKLL